MKPSLRRTFGAPLLIAGASVIGLLSALLGDGAFDIASWIALGAPLAVIVWARLARNR